MKEKWKRLKERMEENEKEKLTEGRKQDTNRRVKKNENGEERK